MPELALTLPNPFVTVEESGCAPCRRHRTQRSMQMRGKIVLAGLILALSGGALSAQERGLITTQDDIYCSGTITSESVPRDTFLITGEESNYKVTFQEGDYVYINKGSSQGVKVGDQFSVVRAITDPTDIEWTKWQFSILKKIGT